MVIEIIGDLRVPIIKRQRERFIDRRLPTDAVLDEKTYNFEMAFPGSQHQRAALLGVKIGAMLRQIFKHRKMAVSCDYHNDGEISIANISTLPVEIAHHVKVAILGRHADGVIANRRNFRPLLFEEPDNIQMAALGGKPQRQKSLSSYIRAVVTQIFNHHQMPFLGGQANGIIILCGHVCAFGDEQSDCLDITVCCRTEKCFIYVHHYKFFTKTARNRNIGVGGTRRASAPAADPEV